MHITKKLQNTKKQEQLLQVLANPEHKNKSIKEICVLANISEQYFYQLRRYPSFIERVKAEIGGMIVASAPQIVQAFTDKAKRGSYEHGKYLLQAIDIGKDTPITQTIVNIQSRTGVTDEELDKSIAKYFAKDAQVVGGVEGDEG